jgi:predicted nucleic acid-binding protein
MPVLVDVLTEDPRWAPWSIRQLEDNSDAGLVINPVTYEELCFGSPSIEFVDGVVRQFGLIYQDVPRQGLFRAAKAFAQHKSRKGTKISVLPDFFIGGHAEVVGMPLLTRDTKRLITYFPTVNLICLQQAKSSVPGKPRR